MDYVALRNLADDQLLTPPTNYSTPPRVAGIISKFQWTNADIVALGAVLNGTMKFTTLPARTLVKRVWMNIVGQGAGVATLTASFGRTSANYIDYMTAQDAKAAAGTSYYLTAVLGGNMPAQGDVPSLSSTTDLYVRWVSTGSNLNTVTGSAGEIFLETFVMP